MQALRYEEPEFLSKMEDPSPLTTAFEEPYSDGEEWREGGKQFKSGDDERVGVGGRGRGE